MVVHGGLQTRAMGAGSDRSSVDTQRDPDGACLLKPITQAKSDQTRPRNWRANQATIRSRPQVFLQRLIAVSESPKNLSIKRNKPVVYGVRCEISLPG